MPFEKGDFILIDYVARVKDTGEIFDVTIEEVARKENVFRENEIYRPILVVLGEGWLLKSLEEKLMEMEQGEEKDVELSPEEAFGSRDPSKIKVIPARELSKRGITPRPGITVEMDGKPATVRSVGSGRVVLDFNHPLAGKTLIYHVKIVKKLDKDKDKILALIDRRIPNVNIEKFSISIRKGTVTIEIPEEARFLEGIQFAKRGIARDLEHLFPEISSVRFVETYTFKRERKVKSAEKSKEEVEQNT